MDDFSRDAILQQLGPILTQSLSELPSPHEAAASPDQITTRLLDTISIVLEIVPHHDDMDVTTAERLVSRYVTFVNMYIALSLYIYIYLSIYDCLYYFRIFLLHVYI